MKRLLALLLTLLLALPCGFTLAEEPSAKTDDIASILNSLLDAVQEKTEGAIADKVGEVTDALSDKLGVVIPESGKPQICFNGIAESGRE